MEIVARFIFGVIFTLIAFVIGFYVSYIIISTTLKGIIKFMAGITREITMGTYDFKTEFQKLQEYIRLLKNQFLNTSYVIQNNASNSSKPNLNWKQEGF